MLRRHCEALGRDPATLRISQQTMVVIGSDDADAKRKLEKAQRIYGGHMGSGIAGTPAAVHRPDRRAAALGCTLLIIEFFGRDIARAGAAVRRQVMPAFA